MSDGGPSISCIIATIFIIDGWMRPCKHHAEVINWGGFEIAHSRTRFANSTQCVASLMPIECQNSSIVRHGRWGYVNHTSANKNLARLCDLSEYPQVNLVKELLLGKFALVSHRTTYFAIGKPRACNGALEEDPCMHNWVGVGSGGLQSDESYISGKEGINIAVSKRSYRSKMIYLVEMIFSSFFTWLVVDQALLDCIQPCS